MKLTKSIWSSLFLAAILVITLSACGGSSGSSGTDTGSGGGSGADGVVSAIVALLTGTWETGCITMSDGTITIHIITTVTFDGAGNAPSVVNYYSDSSCSTPTGMVKNNNDSYSVGEQTTASGMTAYKIDSTHNSGTLTQGGVVINDTVFPQYYDIFAIVGGNTLYFATEAGNTPETRPTTLDLSVPWTRQ